MIQVVITTYQTLVLDFNMPTDLDEEEEVAWAEENGYVLFARQSVSQMNAWTILLVLDLQLLFPFIHNVYMLVFQFPT